MISRIRHTGLVVADISKSIAFYEGLGFKIWKHELEVGSFISTVVGLDNVEIETAKLKIDDSSVLELLEYKSHPTFSGKLPYPSQKHGCSHVAFTVRNIEEVATRIVRLGGSVVNPPALSADASVKVMYCHDVDGILMEMVEEI